MLFLGKPVSGFRLIFEISLIQVIEYSTLLFRGVREGQDLWDLLLHKGACLNLKEGKPEHSGRFGDLSHLPELHVLDLFFLLSAVIQQSEQTA